MSTEEDILKIMRQSRNTFRILFTNSAERRKIYSNIIKKDNFGRIYVPYSDQTSEGVKRARFLLEREIKIYKIISQRKILQFQKRIINELKKQPKFTGIDIKPLFDDIKNGVVKFGDKEIPLNELEFLKLEPLLDELRSENLVDYCEMLYKFSEIYVYSAEKLIQILQRELDCLNNETTWQDLPLIYLNEVTCFVIFLEDYQLIIKRKSKFIAHYMRVSAFGEGVLWKKRLFQGFLIAMVPSALSLIFTRKFLRVDPGWVNTILSGSLDDYVTLFFPIMGCFYTFRSETKFGKIIGYSFLLMASSIFFGFEFNNQLVPVFKGDISSPNVSSFEELWNRPGPRWDIIVETIAILQATATNIVCIKSKRVQRRVHNVLKQFNMRTTY